MPIGGQIFGQITDRLIDQAPCSLLMVKQGTNDHAYPRYLSPMAHWLMPVAGGPNIEKMLNLLPALFSLYPEENNPQLLISKVYLPRQSQRYDPFYDLKNLAERWSEQLQRPIIPIPVCSTSIADALSDLAEMRECAAIVLGASREGLLKNVIHGNLPTQIASQTNTTVFIFRGPVDSPNEEAIVPPLAPDFGLDE